MNNNVKRILQEDEQVIYASKPVLGAYLLNRCLVLVIIVVGFSYINIKHCVAFFKAGRSVSDFFKMDNLVPVLIMLIPFMILLWTVYSTLYNYPHENYLITNKRLLLFHGRFAPSQRIEYRSNHSQTITNSRKLLIKVDQDEVYQNIPFEDIRYIDFKGKRTTLFRDHTFDSFKTMHELQNYAKDRSITVNVNLVEKIFNTGSVRLSYNFDNESGKFGKNPIYGRTFVVIDNLKDYQTFYEQLDNQAQRGHGEANNLPF